MALKPQKDYLAQALAFVETVARGPASYAPYCQFVGGWLVGYDGIVAAGMRTNEALPFAPRTETLRKAILKAGQPYSLAVKDNGRLIVRGDKFRAEIDGYSLEHTPNVWPDMPTIAIDANLGVAVKEAARIASAKADRIFCAAVNLRPNCAVGTSGDMVIEARHNSNLAQAFLLPVEFATALEAVKYAPTAAGHGEGTFTLWFGEGAWLRCQTYSETYPDTDAIFARTLMDGPDWRDVPPGLDAALDAIKPFLASSGLVRLSPQGVACYISAQAIGASCTLQSHLHELVLPWKTAAIIAKHKWFGVTREHCIWQSDATRGVAILPKEAL